MHALVFIFVCACPVEQQREPGLLVHDQIRSFHVDIFAAKCSGKLPYPAVVQFDGFATQIRCVAVYDPAIIPCRIVAIAAIISGWVHISDVIIGTFPGFDRCAALHIYHIHPVRVLQDGHRIRALVTADHRLEEPDVPGFLAPFLKYGHIPVISGYCSFVVHGSHIDQIKVICGVGWCTISLRFIRFAGI